MIWTSFLYAYDGFGQYLHWIIHSKQYPSLILNSVQWIRSIEPSHSFTQLQFWWNVFEILLTCVTIICIALWCTMNWWHNLHRSYIKWISRYCVCTVHLRQYMLRPQFQCNVVGGAICNLNTDIRNYSAFMKFCSQFWCFKKHQIRNTSTQSITFSFYCFQEWEMLNNITFIIQTAR